MPPPNITPTRLERSPKSRPLAKIETRYQNINNGSSMLASFIYAPPTATERLLEQETTRSKLGHLAKLEKQVNDLERVVKGAKSDDISNG